jgi:hypothetical protein
MWRYPQIFQRLKDLCPRPKRVLSFGCSWGDEVNTLREMYPKAKIDGYDNKVYKCGLQNISDFGKYDVITCMSVLYGQHVTFEDFSFIAKLLDSHLKYNGFLVIFNAKFRFMDITSISRKYLAIESGNVTSEPHIQVYMPNGVTPITYRKSFIFKKIR